MPGIQQRGVTRLLTPIAFGLAGAALACQPAPGAGAIADGIRHVVFISLDTLRADHVGCYGHPFVQTPTLDGLAAEGVRFDQCISTTSTTLSSHTSLFTGTYPHTHGVLKNGYAVHLDNRMLPEILGEVGFECAGFVGAAPLDAAIQFNQGFDHYDAEYPGDAHQRRADAVTDATLDWLDGRESRARSSDRLFLFVHYYDIHSPYTEPEPYAGMYREDDLDVDGSIKQLRDARRTLTVAGVTEATPDHPIEDGFAERVRNSSGNALAVAKALDAEYCAGVTWTDAQLGRLLDGLRERGILDEALLVVTADHGETFHEHSNVFNHGTTVYDTEIHVPLILRFPDGRASGSVIDRLTSGVDVLPTMLALLDLPIPPGLDGEDVSPALSGQMPPRGPVFAEATKPIAQLRFNDDPEWPNRRKFQCIRTERYKYMYRLPDEQFMLYDLEKDPGEERNLLLHEIEPNAERAKEFDAALRTWSASITPARRTGIVDSEKQQRALEALGYGGQDD